jgi:hypothetical protein
MQRRTLLGRPEEHRCLARTQTLVSKGSAAHAHEATKTDTTPPSRALRLPTAGALESCQLGKRVQKDPEQQGRATGTSCASSGAMAASNIEGGLESSGKAPAIGAAGAGQAAEIKTLCVQGGCMQKASSGKVMYSGPSTDWRHAPVLSALGMSTLQPPNSIESPWAVRTPEPMVSHPPHLHVNLDDILQ